MGHRLFAPDWIWSGGRFDRSWVSRVKRFSRRETSRNARSTVCFLTALKASV